MGVWKGKGLEVKRSRGLDIKPCRHLHVYVAGRLDVHHPCDPPCRGGLAIVIAGFLFAQNPMKKTSFSFYSSCFACLALLVLLRLSCFACLALLVLLRKTTQDIICPVQLYKNLPCLSTLRFVALRLAKFNLRFFSNQLSLNIH